VSAIEISVAGLMSRSGVGFGTSGARGLVADMTDQVCYVYVCAFLQYLERNDEIVPGCGVAVACDYRSSSPRIAVACLKAIEDTGYWGEFCGYIPTPAVAFYGIQKQIPSIMVTGSHIPDDRNGIKFYKTTGEILKHDEGGIKEQRIDLPDELFDADGSFSTSLGLPAENPAAREMYVKRYQTFFPSECLSGLSVGIYQHSSVVRDILPEVIEALGGKAVPLERSEQFVPVDTEAIRTEDIELARAWVKKQNLNSIVSTDGDGDRPLVSDEFGEWLRGDIVGILCARYLDSDIVVTPVSSNSAVERCGQFRKVLRTRIGSPYVIKAMERAVNEGGINVAGYEANGGFLQATEVRVGNRTLAALPTRDAVLPILCILATCQEQGKPVSSLVSSMPQRYTHSDRLKQFPIEISQSRLSQFEPLSKSERLKMAEQILGGKFGGVVQTDLTDGIRITHASGDIVHLRPSGNAPELRCYTEADTSERAREINRQCVEMLEGWRA